MELIDLSVAKRQEVVLLALDWALQDLTSPATTAEVAKLIARRLRERNMGLISRVIVKAADRIPEAARGDVFQKFGKTMRRVVWYPKGQLPSGGITRKAVRDARTLTDDEMWINYCHEHGIDPNKGPEPKTEKGTDDELWTA